MSESRDRLERPVDHAEVFVRRRSEGILDEQEMTPNFTGTPIARTTTTTTAQHRPVLGPTGGGGHLRRSFGTPIAGGRTRNLYRSPAMNRENTSAGSSRRRSRGRGRNSVLPHWYPRTPLRDITAVVRAIQRSRARLRDNEGLGSDSPVPQDERVLDSTIAVSGDHERNISMVSPIPTVGKVPKILFGITNQNVGESDSLTPQKKLLNSIDKVEKVVMEELQKLKRTPSAKKAEREKRVRTLMSMR